MGTAVVGVGEVACRRRSPPREEAEQVLASVPRLPSEATVRAVITELNQKIDAANRTVLEGPPLDLMPLDVDAVVESWRERWAG